MKFLAVALLAVTASAVDTTRSYKIQCDPSLFSGRPDPGTTFGHYIPGYCKQVGCPRYQIGQQVLQDGKYTGECLECPAPVEAKVQGCTFTQTTPSN